MLAAQRCKPSSRARSPFNSCAEDAEGEGDDADLPPLPDRPRRGRPARRRVVRSPCTGTPRRELDHQRQHRRPRQSGRSQPPSASRAPPAAGTPASEPGAVYHGAAPGVERSDASDRQGHTAPSPSQQNAKQLRRNPRRPRARRATQAAAVKRSPRVPRRPPSTQRGNTNSSHRRELAAEPRAPPQQAAAAREQAPWKPS